MPRDARSDAAARLAHWRRNVTRIAKGAPHRRRTPARPPRWLVRGDAVVRLADETRRLRVPRGGTRLARSTAGQSAGERWRVEGWPRR